MKREMTRCGLILLGLAALPWLAACAGTPSAARLHPVEVSGPPLCSECHDAWATSFDHAGDFSRSHRFPASRDQRLCESCHRPSFCSDCHAYGEELKPSDKRKDSPSWRDLPHRGDYLTRHRIDGKLDPASCFKCHGRRNDWRCRGCHR